MKALMFILAFAVVGCDGKMLEREVVDQCLRSELFKSCMQLLPKGPDHTTFNDWAEVVKECENAAFFQSVRLESQIKPGCRG